jgi:hypothetical protein
MSRNTVESCDCCGKTVAETGFKGDTRRIYRRRIRLWEWITGNWLGWHLAERGWQTICGEWWDAIGKAVASGGDQRE